MVTFYDNPFVDFVMKSHQMLYPLLMSLLGLMTNRYYVEDVPFMKVASYFLRTYTTRITSLNKTNFQERFKQKHKRFHWACQFVYLGFW